MKIHTPETAPAASAEAFNNLIDTFGWSPNVLGVFAGSPALIQAYQSLSGIIAEHSAFTEVEREIIQITNNIENDCTYCMAAHSTVIEMKGLLSEDQLEALRTSSPLADVKHEALRTFSLAVLQKQGRVTNTELNAFKSAGYSDEHALEVNLHSAYKVITNFTNNMANPPLDAPFTAKKWPTEKCQDSTNP